MLKFLHLAGCGTAFLLRRALRSRRKHPTPLCLRMP